MASTLSIRRILAISNTRRASRRFCSSPRLEEIRSALEKLARSVAPTVVSVASFFYGSDDRKVPQLCRGGNVIFLNPTLILTSAHIVGRLDGTVDNDGHILYKSRIGSTVALTAHGQPLEARPLAVNFVRDVALLEVAPKSNPPQGTVFHHFGLANSHRDKGSILMTIDQIHDFQPAGRLIRVRAVGENH